MDMVLGGREMKERREREDGWCWCGRRPDMRRCERGRRSRGVDIGRVGWELNGRLGRFISKQLTQAKKRDVR